MTGIVTVDTFGYKLMLFLHIAAVIVAFAPAFVWPLVTARLRRTGEPAAATAASLRQGDTRKVYGPATVLAGLFGFGLVGMSKPEGAPDPVFEFSQTWISISMLLWFVLLAVQFALMAPAEDKAAEGDADAAKKLPMFTGIQHLLLVLLLILMIWKPGL